MKTLLLLSIFFSLWLSSIAQAEDLSVLAPQVSGLVEEDGTGAYQQVLREAAKRANLRFTERFYPYKRALVLFEEHQGTCIYSPVDPFEESLGTNAILASTPLGGVRMHVFTRKGEPVITAADQLKGKRVGGMIGLDSFYKDIIEHGAELDYVPADVQNVKKLQAGRIDAFIGALPDLNPVLEHLDYAPEYVLVESYDRILCHNTITGAEFIKAISPVFESMKSDGTLAALMGRHHLELREAE